MLPGFAHFAHPNRPQSPGRRTSAVDVGRDTRLLGDDRAATPPHLYPSGRRLERCPQPAATSAQAICCSVAPMSCVFVVVIDWTDAGCFTPPTGTFSDHQLMRRLAGTTGVTEEGIPKVGYLLPPTHYRLPGASLRGHRPRRSGSLSSPPLILCRGAELSRIS